MFFLFFLATPKTQTAIVKGKGVKTPTAASRTSGAAEISVGPSGAATPRAGIATPRAEVTSSRSVSGTPQTGGATPRADIASPRSIKKTGVVGSSWEQLKAGGGQIGTDWCIVDMGKIGFPLLDDSLGR